MMGIEFPPLLTGLAVAGDPFEMACDAAETAEPGTVFFNPEEDNCRAAILLAPEVPLGQAVSVAFAVLLGMNDAIGALGPPEVAVHLEWPGTFRVNGAACGGMTVRASTDDAQVEPDWLVVGLEVPVRDAVKLEPGANPDRTTLHAEGCGDIAVPDLIETWARHMMNWLHIYLTDGFAPLHEEWRSRAYRLGEEVDNPEPGRFVGLDEWGGMILQAGKSTRILPLIRLMERQ